LTERPLDPFVLIRGGGDLASGVALRLRHAGMRVLVTELAQPLAVRRLVSFAEAVYAGEITIEDVRGVCVGSFAEIPALFQSGALPVLVDPQAEILRHVLPQVVVDGRMIKEGMESLRGGDAPFVIGLGPGFKVGATCHAVVETKRGPFLGRVYWTGSAEEDTGLPETVGAFQAERVLRAPQDGLLVNHVQIGARVQKGQELAEVDGTPVKAHFDGILRGMLHAGLPVRRGLKIGDLDPRLDERLCCLVSDKALAVGGAVLEAILSVPHFRGIFWQA
jgi:xanthine dehydrogenase accessory factor